MQQLLSHRIQEEVLQCLDRAFRRPSAVMWLRRKHGKGVCGTAEVSAADQIISGLWIKWRPYLGFSLNEGDVFQTAETSVLFAELLQTAQHLPTCLIQNFLVSAATSWCARVISSRANKVKHVTWYKNRTLNIPQESSDKTCLSLKGRWCSQWPADSSCTDDNNHCWSGHQTQQLLFLVVW